MMATLSSERPDIEWPCGCEGNIAFEERGPTKFNCVVVIKACETHLADPELIRADLLHRLGDPDDGH